MKRSVCSNRVDDSKSIGVPENCRALVIEDHPILGQLLKDLLLVIGYEVRLTTTGQAAIEQWQRWQPHIILVDLLLPDLDGYEVTRYIRQTQRSFSPTIVAISAHGFKQSRDSAIAAGCDDFVSKPFMIETLLEKLGQNSCSLRQFDAQEV